jgi:hypothetical protein
MVTSGLHQREKDADCRAIRAHPGYLRIAVKIISPEAMPGSGGEECFAGCGDAKAVCWLARGGGGASDMPGFCAFSQVRKAYRS